MTQTIGGFDVVLGTREADSLQGEGLRQLFFGLAGDDTLANTIFEGEAYLAGGTGNDSYVVSPNSFTIVHETGGDPDDEFIDSIAVGSGDPVVARVDGRHLLFNYPQTATAILFVDWELEANRIETFRLYDGAGLVGISFDELQAQVEDLPGFVGETTLAALGLVEDLAAGIEAVIEAVAAGTLPGGVDQEAAQTVALLYEAGLDRDGAIDFAGLNFWIDQADAGLSFRDMAVFFVESVEFTESFGPVGALTNEEYVDLLYRNVLGRDGDAAGLVFWNAIAAAPDADRAQLLLDFARSVENAESSAVIDSLTEVAPGIWDFEPGIA